MEGKRGRRFAEVAVTLPIEKTLTYSVPEHLQDVAAPGQRLIVPVGKALVTGYLVGFSREATVEGVRPIREIPDPEPVLDEHMLVLTRWVAEYYMCPWGEVLRAALPPGMGGRGRRVLALRDGDAAPGDVAEADRQVIELLGQRGPLSPAAIRRRLPGLDVEQAVRRLLREGIVRVETYLPSRGPREGVETWYRPAPGARGGLQALEGRAPRQAEILAALLEAPHGLRAADLHRDGGDRAVRALAGRGLAIREARAAPPDPFRGALPGTAEPGTALAPTPHQREALAWIRPRLAAGGFAAALLFGVTGSGKTEVYLQAIAEAIGRGRQALALVPEISLTPLAVARFRARFGGAVAVLHSGLSPTERRGEWRRIRSGGADIVIGARSAVFAPLSRLGIVVVDEEHDTSYKQEEVPRYHARDVALMRARLLGATAILGSATPSFESFRLAQEGRYQLLCLPERVEARPLPTIGVVDMRREARGRHPFLSPALADAVRERLARGEQILLFLNRRGFSTVVLCRDCGAALGCPRCSVSLTYHTQTRRMRCHYCDYQRRPPETCPACNGAAFQYLGFGTQQVEEAIRGLFPAARVARMDRETTRRRFAHAAILARLGRGEIDILVGTQMIGKGHDFPRVTLAGIVSADMGLHLPDFRAGERTFALLTQVAGRAGRGAERGLAVIQTFNPNHYILRAVQEQDYLALWEAEAPLRQERRLPPFARMVAILVSSPREAAARTAAERLARLLKTPLKLRSGWYEIDGPAPAPLYKLKGRFRWHVLLRGDRATTLRTVAGSGIDRLHREGATRGVQVQVTVDPTTLC